MQQKPSCEADSFSAIHEVPSISTTLRIVTVLCHLSKLCYVLQLLLRVVKYLSTHTRTLTPMVSSGNSVLEAHINILNMKVFRDRINQKNPNRV